MKDNHRSRGKREAVRIHDRSEIDGVWTQRFGYYFRILQGPCPCSSLFSDTPLGLKPEQLLGRVLANGCQSQPFPPCPGGYASRAFG
jgi:hypothetical protein